MPKQELWRQLALLIALTSVPASAVLAQRMEQVGTRRPLSAVPEVVRPQMAALGNRLVPGKERLVLSGRFIDEQGRQKQARMTTQPGGLVRLEGFADITLSFDGETRSRRNTKSDDNLLETFSMDTADGMAAALQAGASGRLIGHALPPGPEERDRLTRYDIYEVVGRVPSASDDAVRWKLYHFDSASRLLASTDYRDGDVQVVIRFSEWRGADGIAYPGRIERFEDGRMLFMFTADEAAAGPALDRSSFRQ